MVTRVRDVLLRYKEKKEVAAKRLRARNSISDGQGMRILTKADRSLCDASENNGFGYKEIGQAETEDAGVR